MAIPSIPRLAVLTLGLALAAAASAADEAQLVEAINAYPNCRRWPPIRAWPCR